MTKVAPCSQKTIPIVPISDQVFRSFVNKSKSDTVEMSDLATSTNEHRLSVPKEFCEFNSLGANQQKECYHITCRYKRKRVQNSICESDSVPNLDNEACFATISTLSSEKRIHDERAKQRLKTFVAILK